MVFLPNAFAKGGNPKHFLLHLPMSLRRRSLDDFDSRDADTHNKRLRSSSDEDHPKKWPTFPSYLDVPNLPPKIHLLCDIIAKTPAASSVSSALDKTGVHVTSPEEVEEVLKLSYAYPGPATSFFRWSGVKINERHSPYCWNLFVDLLGKNFLFDAMWEAVENMRGQEILSLATFASIFSSYAVAGRLDESFKSFNVMDHYGVPRDVTALNSLLSAICRLGKTRKAREYLDIAGKTIRPDPDSYAILLEGWENEGDARNALDTFAEMVGVIGWDPANVPAYDSFLTTISRGRGGMTEAMKHLSIIKDKGCSPGLKFFRTALGEYQREKDGKGATHIWEMMAWKREGCRPDISMYNDMIRLYCHLNQLDSVYKLTDEMILYGLFPDAETYNLILRYLVREGRPDEFETMLVEMLKNEHVPAREMCKDAVKSFLKSTTGSHVELASRVWRRCMTTTMMESSSLSTPSSSSSLALEEPGNSLILKLRDLDKLPEACKFAEEMAEKGIKVHSSTMSKLRSSLTKLGKGALYDQLLQKWKKLR